MSLQALVEQIREVHVSPEDAYEVAAILESKGWTDARVQSDLGYESVFDAADAVWALLQDDVQLGSNDYVTPPTVANQLWSAVRQFLRGMIFALPMALSIASMVFLRFSLWSYQYLSVDTATAIAIGTILSFWTVGGFVQAIARRGFFYIYQGYYGMAKKQTMHYIVYGVITSIGISVLLTMLNTVFPVLPYSMVWTSVTFYVVLNSIWLAVAAMYILGREFIFTGLIVLGIGFVYVGFVVLRLPILRAQLLSMAVITLLSLCIVYYLFQRKQSKSERDMYLRLPRAGYSVYSVMPYFIYGFMYFALLFVDRIMAWSTHSPSQYVIWFRGDYEVGLDFALLCLIIPMGMSEVVVSRLMNDALYYQKYYPAARAADMNALYVRRYRKSQRNMAAVAAISAIGVYFGVKWLMVQYVFAQQRAILVTAHAHFVFIVGLISYAVLAVALLNAVVMFSLSRPDLVLRPLSIATVVNIIIGFVCSRWFNYTDAIFGLLAGSLLFSYLTTKNAFRVLRQFDYHLYLLS